MLNPYALPLIDVARAVSLLDIMEKIYQNLRQLYCDYLNESIEAVTLIDNIDGYDINQKEDKVELLEGLYYLRELHQAFTSISRNFPYAEDSKVIISESVLRYDSMGGIILDYFKTHYAEPVSPSSPDLSTFLGGDETKLIGADSADEEIQPEQPKMLGYLKWVQQNRRIFLKPINLLFAFVAVFISLFFYLF